MTIGIMSFGLELLGFSRNWWLITYKWLRTDFVRPSPFLGCEQSRALDGSGTLLVLLIGISEWNLLCRGRRGEVFVDYFGLLGNEPPRTNGVRSSPLDGEVLLHVARAQEARCGWS